MKSLQVICTSDSTKVLKASSRQLLSSGFYFLFLWLFWGFQHKNSFVTKTLVFKITTIWPHKCLILFQLNVQKPSSNARIKKGVWISGGFVMLIQIAWINQMKKIVKMVIFFFSPIFSWLFSNPDYFLEFELQLF